MKANITLAPGADANGLAVMMSELIPQNLEAKPHKKRDFAAISGSVSIVAEDAEVALTLSFKAGALTIHDGIFGIPDVTIRGPSDAILAMSNIPLTRRFGLPFAARKDKAGRETLAEVKRAMDSGALHAYGMLFHLPMMLHLTRVMSVNG
ncbi:MAG: SCP2 sterol-binding domain-containing protein [Polyangiaceae bacterium]